ncbi:MAG: hypothetical protein KC492_08410, partial [Myxococcales bacterium]|nr:hypothetical protein [Myxococcales bacterium]
MELPISLTTYAILLGHMRHFPKDRHEEVLERLDFEPGEWPSYAARGEHTLLKRMEAGEDTTEFTKALGETKRELKRRNPTVEELPLDHAAGKSDEGPPRTMRLRDLDPVEFLNVISSRMGAGANEQAGAPALEGFELSPAPQLQVPPQPRVPPLPPRPLGVPSPVAPPAFAKPNVAPPAMVAAPAPVLSPAEEARRRTRAAKAAFESTKVSPTSERMASDSSPRVDVTVKESVSSPFAAAPPSEPQAKAAPPESPPLPPENEASPETQMIQPEDAAFPGLQLPTLSIFEFATLCAE